MSMRILIVFLLVSPIALYSQVLGNRMIVRQSTISLVGLSKVEEGTEGTPYLNNDFKKGTVYSNGSKFSNVPLRYDIHDDRIEFLQNGAVYQLDPNSPITKIVIDQDVFVVEKYEFKGKEKIGYLLRLDSGRAVLMAKLITIYKERQEPTAMQYTAIPAKYTRLGNVYYMKEANRIVQIESLKKIAGLFADRQNELNSFIKSENLSLREETDLVKLFKYYNSLK